MNDMRKLMEIADTKAGLNKAFQLTKDSNKDEEAQEAFLAGYFAGFEDCEYGRDDEYAALSDWQKKLGAE